MTIPQGTQFGPYKILEQIGSGGMGDVYRAQDTRLGLLGLGRAYAMVGDKADAKAAYDHFFAEWKNADSGLAAQAKKEYLGF